MTSIRRWAKKWGEKQSIRPAHRLARFPATDLRIDSGNERNMERVAFTLDFSPYTSICAWRTNQNKVGKEKTIECSEQRVLEDIGNDLRFTAIDRANGDLLQCVQSCDIVQHRTEFSGQRVKILLNVEEDFHLGEERLGCI